jgi:hypothetical protein
VAVSFWELEAPGADPDDAVQWPAEGATWPLLPTDHGGIVRIDIVPVQYNADGTGRLPDISPEQLRLLEESLLQMYPAREVVLSVRDVLPVDYEFDRGGDAMGALLSSLRDLRPSLDIAWDTYLYGMVNPRDTYLEFCNLGCTAGISYRPTNPINESLRVGVGLGFSGGATGYIMAHEIGHGHDRGHAPCGGAGNVDPDFPYPDGGIGVRGWSVTTGDHIEFGAKDVMGYCQPDWISDYSFNALHERMAAIEGLRGEQNARAYEVWTPIDLVAGQVRIGEARTMRFEPEGELVSLRLLDGAGGDLGSVEGWFVPMTHIRGGTVLVRGELPAHVADVGLPHDLL